MCEHRFRRLNDQQIFCERCGMTRTVGGPTYIPYPYYPMYPVYPYQPVIWGDTKITYSINT